MRQTLKLHPDSRCSAITQIEVVLARPQASVLLLSYRATGAIGDLRIPSIVAAARADELWRHTCFEAFVRPNASGEVYYEFNFAPSTQWAAYAFDGYRSGMRVAADVGEPQIVVNAGREIMTLQASLDLDGLRLPGRAPWRLGLSAVIEEANGRKSYWALAHPPGKPDFHHADCFALELSNG